MQLSRAKPGNPASNLYKQVCMIIDMLTRWFNFEFGVLSRLKTVSLQPINCYAHLVV